MVLDTRLLKFVEAHSGEVLSCRKGELGASRITWFIETIEGACVLRVDSGDGPVANTPLTLAREASVYTALADSSVRIPKLVAQTRDALLVELVSGVPDLTTLDVESKNLVMEDLVDALSELHTHDASHGFEALTPPSKPADAAVKSLELWQGIFNSRVSRASPLATFASSWLLENAPMNAERLVVCHGDVGPGNFLHEKNKVTAILDWEFVHIGDPMDDLAWLAFRGHHFNGDLGDFNAQLVRWQENTGFELDRKRIAYYRIMVMYIWLVSCLAALDNGARSQDRFTYLNLVSLMNVIMPRAMMEFEGAAIPQLDVSIESQNYDLAEHTAALADLIELRWPQGDAANKSYVSAMAQQTLSLARQTKDILAQNQEALEKLLGQLIAPDQMDVELSQWIKRHPEQDTAILELLYANGQRRMTANPAMLPIAQKPFLAL